MTFYGYMMKNHRWMETDAGKLAAMMNRDREHFPRNSPMKFGGWHKLILDYIRKKSSYIGLEPVFENCWVMYEQMEREKRRRRRNAGKAD